MIWRLLLALRQMANLFNKIILHVKEHAITGMFVQVPVKNYANPFIGQQMMNI